VAQQEKDKLLKKVPYLDFVFGPDSIAKLPEIIGRVQGERERVVETAWVDSEEYVFPRADPETSRGKVSEFVTVMKGCDNVCAFCVVPHTRGREVSRAFPEVLAEVADLAKVGVREVTLIGQNVNSYRGGINFAQLLLRTAEVPGIERVRFTTSHPHDLSDELIEAFRVQPKIMPHFHLPVQSGSNPVLKRMRRDYTVVEYLERLEKLRAARPNIAVTTDIIVGFPGETEEDFALTLELTEKVRYDNQFSFIYSPRPKTGAALKENEWGLVPHEVKIERLERLQKIQRRISGELTQEQVGQEVEVLVEGPSRYNPLKRFGRTPENRTVNFDGDAPAGAFVKVLVESATPNQLSGKQTAVLSLPTVMPAAEAPQPELSCVVA
jgi:tRNA-2-methylthio-N6-dimethylallyladenosine synthase